MKTLLFARDPGAADIVSHIYPLVPGERIVLGKDYASAVFLREGIHSRSFNEEFTDKRLSAEDGESIEECLNQYKPDLVITGTAYFDDFSDRLFWKACNARNIPSIAVLDQWLNVEERFIAGGIRHTPDFVLAPSYEIVDVLKDKELCRKDAYVFGNPYLQGVFRSATTVSGARERVRNELKERFSNDFTSLVLYVSEPQRLLKKEVFYGRNRLGDEVETFKIVSSALEESFLEESLLLCKLHPKEDGSEYAEITESLVGNEFNKHELLQAADVVIGSQSTLLLEAVLLERAVIGLEFQDIELPIMNRENLCMRASTASELTACLNQCARGLAVIPPGHVLADALGLRTNWEHQIRHLFYQLLYS